MGSAQAELSGGASSNLKPPVKKKKPNYAQIHAKPLPLDVYPLPNFHPSHPLSILQLALGWLSQAIWPPCSHSAQKYVGYFSSRTRSIHITDPDHIRALWEMGFFGKGLLSRSEPSWYAREKAKFKTTQQGGGTAEEWTAARREERRRFKLERAREERERVERQKALEQSQLVGKLSELNINEKDDTSLSSTTTEVVRSVEVSDRPAEATLPFRTTLDNPIEGISASTSPQTLDKTSSAKPEVRDEGSDRPVGTGLQGVALNTDELTVLETPGLMNGVDQDLKDREHLQLNLEEAFFLVYALGVLSIYAERNTDKSASPEFQPSQQLNHKKLYGTSELLHIFMRHSQYPTQEEDVRVTPDSPFLLNYVAYHHFRSRGWVVRPGVKFSCDFLLYNRGPVFSHAEYAVMIIPSYSHPYWATENGKKVKGSREYRDWWWLHCVNRVQSQVKKTLVLTYIEIPPPAAIFCCESPDKSENSKASRDIGRLLRDYTVREFTVRRWLPNRSRD